MERSCRRMATLAAVCLRIYGQWLHLVAQQLFLRPSAGLLHGSNGYTLSLSNWSHEAGKYMPSNEKMVYHMVADNVLAVDTYRRNDLDEAFERTSGMLVMNADKDYADL